MVLAKSKGLLSEATFEWNRKTATSSTSSSLNLRVHDINSGCDNKYRERQILYRAGDA